MNVIIFGQIADITGKSTVVVENADDTNELIEQLTSAYPALATAKFAIAVDKKIIKGNIALNNNNTVALLPPFSGG